MKNMAYKLEDDKYSMFLDYQIRFPLSSRDQIHMLIIKKEMYGITQ